MSEHFPPAQRDRERPLHPGLAALVQAAQRQPDPEVSVRFEDVQRAAAGRWRRGALAVAVAASLLGAAVWALRGDDPQTGVERGPVEVAAASMQRGEGEGSAASVPKPDALEPAPAPSPRVSLGPGATLEGLDPLMPRPEVAPGAPLDLAAGRYTVRTSAQALELTLGARVLEISAASEVVLDAGLEHVTFDVVRGQASWKTSAAPGQEDPPTVNATRLSAQQLQARAEAAMIRGKSADAIAALRTLVRTHPKSTATKAALLDLARLEKAAGRVGRARCAYALFLQRFPTDARAPAVRTTAQALGPARCRDLEPRTR